MSSYIGLLVTILMLVVFCLASEEYKKGWNGRYYIAPDSRPIAYQVNGKKFYAEHGLIGIVSHAKDGILDGILHTFNRRRPVKVEVKSLDAHVACRRRQQSCLWLRAINDIAYNRAENGSRGFAREFWVNRNEVSGEYYTDVLTGSGIEVYLKVQTAEAAARRASRWSEAQALLRIKATAKREFESFSWLCWNPENPARGRDSRCR